MKNILRNNSMLGVDTCQNKIVSNIIIEENKSTNLCRPESLIMLKTGRIMEASCYHQSLTYIHLTEGSLVALMYFLVFHCSQGAFGSQG